MSEPGQLAESPGGWLRPSRRYSPFNRSPGLRRLPEEGLGFAFIGSLLLHAALIFGLVRATEAPPWSLGADMSLVSVADLVGSVQAGPQGAAVKPDRAAQAKPPQARRSTPSLPPAAPTFRPPDPVRAGDSTRSAPSSAPQPASPRAPSETAEAPAAAPEPASSDGDGRVALLSPANVDNRLDAGSPEPLPAAVAQPAAPAQALTPVPVIFGTAVAAVLSSPVAEPRAVPEEAVATPQPASSPREITARSVEPIPAVSLRPPWSRSGARGRGTGP